MAEPKRSQLVGAVQANIPLCRDHYRLVLKLDKMPATAPGQFVQISCRQWDTSYVMSREVDWTEGAQSKPMDIQSPELLGSLSLLRKPFSIAGRRDVAGGVELEIIHRTVGSGTTWMSSLKPGDSVNLIGPLGNTFPMPADGQVAVMVGGGVGIPPMIYFSSKLAERKSPDGKSAKGVAFAGSLNRDLLPLTVTADAKEGGPDDASPKYNIQEFAQYGIPAVVCTDDGSFGFRGLVTQALEKYLDQYFASCPQKAVVYTCGPEAMMRRVADIATTRGIQCWVSVERAMACGMGTCQSCVIKTKKPEAKDGWAYKLACTDGPIFDSSVLLW